MNTTKTQATMARFYEQQDFKQMFKKELDHRQVKLLDDKKVNGFDDFFSKMDELFFNDKEDQQKFEFFKLVSKILQMDEHQLKPILNKLDINKVSSQQAFQQFGNFSGLGIDQMVIQKIKDQINNMQITTSKHFLTAEQFYPQQQLQQNQQKQNQPQPQTNLNQSQLQSQLSQQQQQPQTQQQKQQQEQSQGLQQQNGKNQQQQSEKNQTTGYLDQLKKNCQKVITSNQIKIDGKQKIVYKYPIRELKDLQNVNNYRCILVIGQKGSGKSSFLNYLLNIYLGVSQEDDFRFIFENSDQPTNDIFVRYIKQFSEKAGLKLIDTPGFIDDLEHKKQPNSIEKIFSHLQIDQKIDCICFVLDANITRLTQDQNLLFEKVIRNFGKNALPNFKFIFTQSLDDNVPTSMQAIKFKGDLSNQESPFAQHLDQIKSPIYFKVNCQNILSDNENKELQIYFWKMTYKSIVDFFVEIPNLIPIQSGKFAYTEKKRHLDNIQKQIEEICNFKDELKRIEKSLIPQVNGKQQLEDNRMKQKNILENRKKFSMQKLKLKKEIQSYCQLSLESFINYTEELKVQTNLKNMSHKKIFFNIIESLQEDFFMYEEKFVEK